MDQLGFVLLFCYFIISPFAMAPTFPGSPLMLAEYPFLALPIVCLPHWLCTAAWGYLMDERFEWRPFLKVYNIIRYGLMLLGGVGLFFAAFSYEAHWNLYFFLTYVLFAATCLFSQVIYKVKENCYPFHKPWIITAICGFAVAYLLSFLIRLIIV